MSLPEYCNPGARLPRGGPDRVRFCVWYADAMDKGLEHETALEDARSMLRFFHLLVVMGGAAMVGPAAGGIPIEFVGEDGFPPA